MDPPWWFWLIPAFLILTLVSSLVALDARKNRIPTTGDEYGFTTGAFVWFLGCLLFIWVALPSYLFRRSSVLRWRTQPLTWDEGTTSCGDYVVSKEEGRIVIWVTSRWAFEQVLFLIGWVLFGLFGIGLLAVLIIDWLQGGVLKGGASYLAFILASLFCILFAVAFYGIFRSELTQGRLPWILDRQEDVFLKGAQVLRSLSSITQLEVTEFQSRGNKWWDVTFAPAVKVHWWTRWFKRDPSFEFESEATAWIFARELVSFLRVPLR